MTDPRLAVRVRRRLAGVARRGARRLRRSAVAQRLRPPAVSVILPIYNVEEYLAECLDSILEQGFADFEVVVVDDGSPDGSRAIAEQYAARDRRLRIVTRENGGLGAARNTGIRHARGRYLTFVDSDDMLSPGALSALVERADRTGADVVVGSVRRFDSERTWRPQWTRQVHAHERSVASVEEFLPLLRNLYTWNKLFRRDFWEAQDLWFREGVAYEDQPIITQLLIRARSIEVLTDVVYRYRSRDDLSSISQQTASLKDLRDRLRAIEVTREVLAREGSQPVREAWLQTLMDSHFHWYLNSSGTTDPTYWAELRDCIRELTADASQELWDRVPPSRRVVLELARQDRREDVWEFVRREGHNLDLWPARVRADGIVLELPFHGDPALPERHFLLLPEQVEVAHVVEHVRWVHDGSRGLLLSVAGWAYLRKVDLAGRRSEVRLVLHDPDSGERRVLVSTVRPAPSFPPPSDDEWCDVSSGTFAVDVPVEELFAESGVDSWRVQLEVSSAGFTASVPVTKLLRRGSAGDVPAGTLRSGDLVAPEWRLFEPLELRRVRRAAEATDVTLTGRTLTLRLQGPAVPELVRVSATAGAVSTAGRVRDGAARLTLPPAEGLSDPRRPVTWSVHGQGPDGRPVPIAVAESVDGGSDGAESSLRLTRARSGQLQVVEWTLGVEALGVEIAHDDTLVVAGRVHGPGVEGISLALRDKRGDAVGDEVEPESGGFTAEVRMQRVLSRFGATPIGYGGHDLVARVRLRGEPVPVDVPVRMSTRLSALLPLTIETEVHEGSVVRGPEAGVRVQVVRPLGQARGRYAQRMLRTAYSRPKPPGGLRRGLLIRSYFGELATDNGLSVQRELRRRGSDLPVYWAVQDRSVVLPEGGVPVVVGTEEWYSLLSSVEYYLDNMYQPEFHSKPDGQVIIQTFHGYPFKQMGHPHWRNLGFSRARIEAYDARARDWDYLVSPARYATPLLARDFNYPGEVLEIGYPRNDVLLSDDAPRIRAEVRRWLGIEDHQRAVLYAPTFRDYLSKDDMRADLVDFFDFAAAHRALGDDYVFLVRGHAFNARTSKRMGARPGTVDVTDYPEVSDLYLAADAAVVDYSSLRFDFGVTGKPMVFHVPDLKRYQDTRGWLFDFEPTAPGPLVATTAEAVEELRDLDGLRERHRTAYERFRSDYLDLEDGHAGRRLVDAVFAPRGDA